MSEDSVLGIPNPLECENPLETDNQVSSGRPSRRTKRQALKHLSYEEENSEIVDDVDWEPPKQIQKVTPAKTTSTTGRLETATSSLDDDDPLKCGPETPDEEAAQQSTTGPLYKDVRRKPQGTDTLSRSDDLIYCFDCLRDYASDCPTHGALNIVKDTPVPVSVKDEFRARKTTPPLVSVAYSKIPGAKTGVWACKFIPERTRFGPYDGKRVTPQEGTSYSWLVRRNGEPDHCVDATEPGLSNWMRYVNSARHRGERNLQAFQFHGKIYFQTSRKVSPHEELLVWFGEENNPPQAAQSGTPEKKTEEFKEAVFKCPACPYAYASPLYLARHTKYCRHLNAPKTMKASANSADLTTSPSTIDTSSSTVKVYPKGGLKSKSTATNSASGRLVSSSTSASSPAPKSKDKVKVIAKPLRRLPERNSEDSASRLLVALKPYQCDDCDERFSSEETLNAHKATHAENQFPCEECSESFSSLATLQNHARTHPVHPFQCTECGERFSHEETLSSHMMTHAGENMLVCCVCSERFFDKETLTSHLRIHTGSDSRVCNLCNELFLDKHLYNAHLKTHSEEKPYGCEACPKRFARLDLAERHQSTHNTAVYECPDCPNRYNRLDTLQRHREKHKGEQPFKCDKCEKQFILKAHLTKHRASHSPSKGESFLCTTCNKSFGGKGALSTHMLAHSQGAVCPLCQAPFKSQCALAFHVKSVHESNVESLEVTPDVESNFVSVSEAVYLAGGALAEGGEEPEIDLSEANIKREIEVSETKFLAVSENTYSSGAEDSPINFASVTVPAYDEVNSPLTVIKSEIEPEISLHTEIDLSPHNVKSEIDDSDS